MKKIYGFNLLILFLIMLLTTSFVPVKKVGVGKITFPLGNVLLLNRGTTQAKMATFNMPVRNGDKIETKKQSRCEITYNDGSVIRVDEQSIYTVEKAEFEKEKKEVDSKLSIGKLWANIKKLVSSKDSWRLKSPAAVVAVRGTVYRMNAGADSSTQVLVYEGNVAVGPATQPGGQRGMGVVPGKPQQVQGPVQVQGPRQVTMGEWLEIVKAQQQIVVRPDGTFAKSDFNLEEDEKLDWVAWNKERDKLLE